MARDRAARPEAKPLRLFVAVDPPERELRRLGEAVAPYRDGLATARWTRPEGWHVTVKFLGAISPRLVERVQAAVRRVSGDTGAFLTSLTAFGVFPGPGRARVVWAGLDDAGERFAALAGALDDALRDVVPPEQRPFSPHLTVARLNPPADVRGAGLVGAAVGGVPFAVERLVLYRSHLSPKGARYEALASFPLRAATEDA